jgi:hypothetical protein
MREIMIAQVAPAMARITFRALSSFSHPIRLILIVMGMGLGVSDNFSLLQKIPNLYSAIVKGLKIPKKISCCDFHIRLRQFPPE